MASEPTDPMARRWVNRLGGALLFTWALLFLIALAWPPIAAVVASAAERPR